MPSNLLSGRTFYHSSGGVNWVRFLPWLFLVFAASGVLASLMFWLFRAGQYYVVIVPAVAALAITGMVVLAVAKGHCRNVWIGSLLGFGAGFAVYFGYYYFGMVADLGEEYAGQIQMLPNYIRVRMATQVLHDVNDSHQDDENARQKSGGAVMNWLGFGFETALILGLPTVWGFHRSRKPYCEACQKWMSRELTYFEPAKSADLLAALETSSVRALAALCATPAFSTVPSTTLALEYCPSLKDGKTSDCPVFLSIKNVTANPRKAALDTFESSKGKLLVRRMLVSRDELPALAPRFSFIEVHTGRSAVAALQPEEETTEKDEKKSGASADITPVEPDYAGRILTLKTKLIGNAFGLAALAGVFAAIGLIAWGGTMAFPQPPAHEVSQGAKVLGIMLVALGGILFLSTAAFVFIDPSWPGNRYVRSVLGRELSRRPTCLVDPRDPEALFVEIVPKLNWDKLALLDSAQDVGLLRVDRGRREILFEGDKERCRIPATAVTYCEVEQRVVGRGSHAATRFYYVVVRVANPDRFWEAPIRERGSTGKFLKGRRKKAAYRLCQQIKEIQGQAQRAAV